jgi:uncharacterized protein (TIGR02453 family)
MSILQQSYFQFFQELRENNTREWFQENKTRYEKEVKLPFRDLLKAIAEEMQDSEPYLIGMDPNKFIFRIHKDLRFSKDKKPYKEHMTALLSPFGTRDKIYPGHYIEISCEKIIIAGGAYWFEDKNMLERVRYKILDKRDIFSKLVNEKTFIKNFGGIVGKKNKKLPKELMDASDIEPLIANNQFYWWKELPSSKALDDNFVCTVKNYFVSAQKLNAFFIDIMY